MNDDYKKLEKELGELRVQMNLSSDEGLQVKPHPDLTEDHIARMKEHKHEIIHNILKVTQESDAVLRCRACALDFRPTEPFVTLEWIVGEGEEAKPSGDQRPYHLDRQCQEKMFALISPSIENGGAHIIHQVHADTCPDENPGYGCSGGCFG